MSTPRSCPVLAGFEPDKATVALAQAAGVSSITISHDPYEAVKGADVIYTGRRAALPAAAVGRGMLARRIGRHHACVSAYKWHPTSAAPGLLQPGPRVSQPDGREILQSACRFVRSLVVAVRLAVLQIVQLAQKCH